MRFGLFFLLGLFQLSCLVSTAQIKTIKIGNQVWMAENLDVDIKGSWAYNGNLSNAEKYGRLYTWQAANKACPEGWRLPSNEEWSKLIDATGGESLAGKLLKEGGSTSFNALFAGYCNGKSFWFLYQYGGFWTSTPFDEKHAWYYYITNKNDAFTSTYFNKDYGFSVRCVKK
jgi:uncharacterized protein (TIGR02145 family)